MRKFITSILLGLMFIAVAASEKELPLPIVPDSLRAPETRADYILLHFWDDLDSTYSKNAIEQAFSNFLSVFPYASDEGREKAVNNLFQKSFDKEIFIELAEKYLYEPESPLVNDEFYIVFLNEIVSNPEINELSKIRPLSQLEEVMKNRVGHKFYDFQFVTSDGETHSVSEIASADSSNLMLMFYDPFCGHCMEVIDHMRSQPLRVLAIYSGDDSDLWRNTLWKIPSSWTVGYEDGTIQEEEAIFLRTLPTLLLLSPSMEILQKNITIE